MNIFITNFYSNKNAGDAAILSVLISELKKEFSKAKINISSMMNIKTTKVFADVPLYSSFFYEAIYTTENPFFRLIKTIYILISSLLWAFTLKILKSDIRYFFADRYSQLLDKIKNADLIVGTGGGYLIGDASLERHISLVLHLHIFLIARILNKPVILYSQSIGPLPTLLQKWYSSFVLNRTQAIITREKITHSYLKEIGVNLNIIYRSTDAAFLFESKSKILSKELLKRFGVDKKKKVVMITVKRLKKSLQSHYEHTISLFVEKLILQKNIQIVFVPQTTSVLHNDDDRKVIERILSKVEKSESIISIQDELTHNELKSLYESADFVIATRMHSAIFAITSFTPTMTIAYEYKTIGIMNDLELGQWVIPIEKISEEALEKMFIDLQKKTHSYKKHLKNILPEYMIKAKHTISIVNKVVSSKK